jgi:hypothetical protein
LNKTIRNKSRAAAVSASVARTLTGRASYAPDRQSLGAISTALYERMTERHGVNPEAAWNVAAIACQQAGGAAKLDTIMATAEASGTSAHDQILATVTEAKAA